MQVRKGPYAALIDPWGQGSSSEKNVCLYNVIIHT